MSKDLSLMNKALSPEPEREREREENMSEREEKG